MKKILIASLALLLASNLYAQGKMRNSQGNCQQLFHKELDLSNEQVDKLTTLKRSQIKEMHQVRSELRGKHLQLRQQMTEAAINEKAAKNLIDEITALRKQQMIMKLDHMMAMRKILNEDQVKKLNLQMMWKGRPNQQGRAHMRRDYMPDEEDND